MRISTIILITIWIPLAVSCIQGSDRCGKLTWQASSAGCIDESDTVNPPEDSEGPAGDGGEDTDPPPVLGGDCTSDADCKKDNADYCVLVPGNAEGFCTLKNCSSSPDDCPADYTCCVTAADADWPNHCMPDELYEEFGEMICTNY
jgi:hypothetical protein